jgi:alpha-tubulin suppressor-like RCC1 family protein
MTPPRAARAAAVFSLLLALVRCTETGELLPTCTEGRSRCVAHVSVGARFACAALLDRTVWCWGRNDESQLGYPTTELCPIEVTAGQTRQVACHTFPFQVNDLDRVTRVAVGDSFACALRDDKTVRCWGGNAAGQLGNGATAPSPRPVAVRGLANVTAVAVGARHACALVGGRVSCWGANDRGQLGREPSARRCTTLDGEVPCEVDPMPVEGLVDVTAITAGAAHTCARTVDGFAVCWGDARYGQLGVGEASSAPGPVPRSALDGELPLLDVVEVAAGAWHTCARNAANHLWCWGRGDHGELGTPPPRMTPEGCMAPCATQPTSVEGYAAPPMDAGAADASADASTDAAEADAPRDDARASDASTDAEDADVADAGDAAEELPPVVPPAPRALAAGGSFSCALLNDGTVRCWGDDSDGQLGDGRRVRDGQPPTLVIATPGAARNNPLQGVTAVAAGSASACALLGDRSLRCWGSNQAGALGNGNVNPQSGPVPVTW